MKSIPKTFASDSNSSVHPEIMAALEAVNQGQHIAYGSDPYTEKAIRAFKKEFGRNTEVYFVFNGTGANIVGLRALLESHQSVLCAKNAHIHSDECAAPENAIGCKLQTISADSEQGKLTPALIKPYLHGFGFEHHSQPKVISITQSTEYGTVYSPGEVKALSKLAKQHGMFLHMDGARLCNAAVALGKPLKAISADCGVDILSFGGTKNGAMFGEAVLVFNQQLVSEMKYHRKQSAQLPSKMRYSAAQFDALFNDGLWKRCALHANQMAKRLWAKIRHIRQIKLAFPVQTNMIYAHLPKHKISAAQKKYFFYVMDQNSGLVRFVASWDTTEADVDVFAGELAKVFRGA